MKTPLAICNLLHQGAKTLVSAGGVAFALLLVFMQLGFMGAVEQTARNVLEKLDCDILIRATDYLHLYEPSGFDQAWLDVAAGTKNVEAATPMWVMLHNWRKLPTADQIEKKRLLRRASLGDSINTPATSTFKSQYLPIAIMAFRASDRAFYPGSVPGLVEAHEALSRSDVILLDDSTKADYGPWNDKRFSLQDVVQTGPGSHPDRQPEIGGQEFQIVGLFKLGTGLAANAAAIMGLPAFERIAPLEPRTNVSLGLLRISQSADVEEVLQRLKQRLRVRLKSRSEDANSPAKTAVSIVTREQAIQAEQGRWLWETPIGLIFQMGVVISLLVGAAIVYMVLATDVANRLPEYATLLAMGYSRGYLSGIVLTQATVLCGIGFVTAWAMGLGLYRFTAYVSGIPLRMTVANVVLVAILGFVMCCVSGVLALRKLWKAEPANLF